MRFFQLALVVVAFLSAQTVGAQEQPVYDDHFGDATMRVDYYHFGDAGNEDAAIDVVIKEGPWPQSRVNLTNAPDNGKYRLKIVDVGNGQSLYEQGYSTLFGEWQTTSEAKAVQRVFHETLRFPFPLRTVRVEIWSRNVKGKLRRVFAQTIDPSSHLVGSAALRKDVEVLTLNSAGTPRESLDVVFLADGYPTEQLEKARRDLKRYATVFLDTPPFDKFKEQINLYGVIPTSGHTGPDEPRKGLARAPAVGTTFNTFDSPRYLTTLDNRAMRDLAAVVPYDSIFIMVNTSRYGGAGIYNFFSVFVSDNEYDEYVFIHEFGHGFAGLADEYYTSSVSYSDFYPKGVEPSEPNITALVDGADNVKWKAMLDKDIPVPTPNERKFEGAVGVFEGAGYSAKGLYRPAYDCKMKSKRLLDFCPVCMKAVQDMIRFHTE